jgi:hypothetical protein
MLQLNHVGMALRKGADVMLVDLDVGFLRDPFELYKGFFNDPLEQVTPL